MTFTRYCNLSLYTTDALQANRDASDRPAGLCLCILYPPVTLRIKPMALNSFHQLAALTMLAQRTPSQEQTLSPDCLRLRRSPSPRVPVDMRLTVRQTFAKLRGANQNRCQIMTRIIECSSFTNNLFLVTIVAPISLYLIVTTQNFKRLLNCEILHYRTT